MRYVIIRDDDTNALTPIDCLERLYRPFLDRGLPVNLAVIPDVATGTTLPDGRPEGYLLARNGTTDKTVPIGSNTPLVRYLLDHSGYHVVQHGCHHDYFEFDASSLTGPGNIQHSTFNIQHPRAGQIETGPEKRSAEIAIGTSNGIGERLDHGTRLLIEAGFPQPQTFVAPYDKLSRASLRQVSERFRVLSTGWFEWRRLPWPWRPRYLAKKIRKNAHWRVGQTMLLSHPGCLLSCHRNHDTMLDDIIRSIHSRPLTVLVTHWWEYFRNPHPDEPFISVLHQTADYLASRSDIKVVSFSDLAQKDIPLN
jgi:hypothetical protein